MMTAKKVATARARWQPMYLARINKQLVRVNPVTQKIFRTAYFVDILPGSRSQSTKRPLTRIITTNAKNGMVESAPLLVMSTPRTLCIYRGRQVAMVM